MRVIRLLPIHPGEVLLREFMQPFGLDQNELARSMGVPARRINEIVQGKRAVTAQTALRLERVLGASARFWLGLQADYDLEVARSDVRASQLCTSARPACA
jgi:addiction module HigA family antidote